MAFKYNINFYKQNFYEKYDLSVLYALLLYGALKQCIMKVNNNNINRS